MDKNTFIQVNAAQIIGFQFHPANHLLDSNSDELIEMIDKAIKVSQLAANRLEILTGEKIWLP